MAATTSTPAATAPQIACRRRRPRRRGARTRTDRPQREQRSRSERSSKPQWGHVRRGHLGHRRRHQLTSVDMMTGYCQSAAVDRFDAGRQPAGRPPAPGRLGYVQALLNTFWDLDREGGGERWSSTAAYGAWLSARGFDGTGLRGRPRPRHRAARGAADAVPGQPRRLRRAGGARRPRRRRACGRPGGGADAEPAHRRPGARRRRPRRGVRARPGDRLRRARRRQLRAAEGVPARPLRLGLLRRLAQPLGTVVLDAHLRQPHQGRVLPPPPRGPAGLIEGLVTAGARRVTVTPRSPRPPKRPATLSHDAMAARRLSPLASATRALGVRPRHLQRHRLVLSDGAVTTLHVATYDLRRTVPRVVRLPRPTPLERWCRAHGVDEAIVGGFFVRPGGTPLGELRTSGIARPARPFDAPWGDVRACLHVVGGRVAIARPRRAARRARRRPPAGRPAARARRRAVRRRATSRASRPAAASSTPTSPSGATRARRSALAPRGRLLAVACDGRADDEAGLTLAELAEALVALGAPRGDQPRRRRLDLARLRRAGCATSRARPTASCCAGGRPVSTVIAFMPR